jgi:hypothetical protein
VRLGDALEHLHGRVEELARTLTKTAERHAADHDVFHVGRVLAGRVESLAGSLEPFIGRYRKRQSDHDVEETWRTLTEPPRRAESEPMERSSKAGLILLGDLRELYVETSETEIDWIIARQGALVARDGDLERLCRIGIEETRRVAAWLGSRIKETSPQVLISPD